MVYCGEEGRCFGLACFLPFRVRFLRCGARGVWFAPASVWSVPAMFGVLGQLS